LRSRRLDVSPLALFAAPLLLETLEGPFPGNLNNAPFLLPMPATRLRRELERWMGERSLKPRVVAEVEDSGLLKALGQDGRGIFAMPYNLHEEVCSQYGVVCMGHVPTVEIRMYAIIRQEPVNNPAIQALLDTRSIA
ncbi:MAG: LysR substrate-binding domain-containing protein, partial [Myxococcota bacterium]